MTAIVRYSMRPYNVLNSRTTFVPTTLVSVREVPTTCLIKEGVLIPVPDRKQFAKVLRPFYILLSPVDEGYVATSPISDIYEQEASAGATTRSYLYSLADELIWLQEHKESLSRPLLKQLDTIQSYLRIL